MASVAILDLGPSKKCLHIFEGPGFSFFFIKGL